ncbi:MAG: hypothetical protein IID32_07380, partial [Planctomycetes bacterium]|nr:hypothetical protein [Planctomycetota bacterium]
MDTDKHGLRLLRCCAPRNDMVWVLLFLLGTVVFQVHGQEYASQDGHALDANPGIGTFGLNVERRFDPLVPRVNMYITGNVRGGGRFQGLIPYRSVQELGLNLGRGTLSDFRRDSTGSLDLGRGVGGAVRPWVDASRQVTRSSGGTIINTYGVHQQSRAIHPALERGGGNTRLAVRPFSLRNYSLNVNVGSQGYGYNPYTPAGGIYQREPTEGVGAGNSFAEILQQERLGPPIDTRPLLGATRNDATILDGSKGSVERPTRQVQEMLEELQEAIPGPLEFSRGGISVSSTGAGEQVRGGLGPLGVRRVVGGAAPAISHIRQAQAAKYIERGEALMRQGSYYQAAEAFGAATIYAGDRVEVLQA